MRFSLRTGKKVLQCCLQSATIIFCTSSVESHRKLQLGTCMLRFIFGLLHPAVHLFSVDGVTGDAVLRPRSVCVFIMLLAISLAGWQLT